MPHYYLSLLSLLVWWFALIFVASSLPGIVRSMKLHDIINAQMIQTIRAVIVTFIVITMVGVLALFVSALIPY